MTEPSSEQRACSSTNEPIEVKLIVAASDGVVRVTPEKCEQIRRLLATREAALRRTVAEECLSVIYGDDIEDIREAIRALADQPAKESRQ